MTTSKREVGNLSEIGEIRGLIKQVVGLIKEIMSRLF